KATVRRNREVEPADSSEGENRCVNLRAISQFLQARDDVPANVRHFQVRIQRQQLRFAPSAARGNNCSRGQILHLYYACKSTSFGLTGRPFGRVFVRLSRLE